MRDEMAAHGSLSKRKTMKIKDHVNRVQVLGSKVQEAQDISE